MQRTETSKWIWKQAWLVSSSLMGKNARHHGQAIGGIGREAMNRYVAKNISGCGKRQGSVDTSKNESNGRRGGDFKRYPQSTAHTAHPLPMRVGCVPVPLKAPPHRKQPHPKSVLQEHERRHPAQTH